MPVGSVVRPGQALSNRARLFAEYNRGEIFVEETAGKVWPVDSQDSDFRQIIHCPLSNG